MSYWKDTEKNFKSHRIHFFGISWPLFSSHWYKMASNALWKQPFPFLHSKRKFSNNLYVHVVTMYLVTFFLLFSSLFFLLIHYFSLFINRCFYKLLINASNVSQTWEYIFLHSLCRIFSILLGILCDVFISEGFLRIRFYDFISRAWELHKLLKRGLDKNRMDL